VGDLGCRVTRAEGNVEVLDRDIETGGGALSDDRAWETVSEAAVCIRDFMARALRRL
jgi:hypothetical protein